MNSSKLRATLLTLDVSKCSNEQITALNKIYDLLCIINEHSDNSCSLDTSRWDSI